MSATALYSAEQIEVFDGLTDVLKDYAKAVIRAAPADLLAFSRDYFAARAAEESASVPATPAALRALHTRLSRGDGAGGDAEDASGDAQVSRDFLLRCCDAANVARSDAERVLRQMRLSRAETVPAAEFTALACCLCAESFEGAVSVLIDCWGGSVPAEEFVRRVGHFAARDPRVGDDFLARLADHLRAKHVSAVTEAEWAAFLDAA